MSVLAEAKDKSLLSFVKGSPEVIQSLCSPHTLPKDFDRELEVYTKSGYRVIALAYKRIDFDPSVLRKDDLRKACESGLTFSALVVMENKLKPETRAVLEKLGEARVRCVMVTGDNVLTAITVAREAALFDKDTEVFAGRVIKGEAGNEGPCVEWVSTSDERLKLDPVTLHLASDATPRFSKLELALTGDVFSVLFSDHQSELVKWQATQPVNTETSKEDPSAAYLNPEKREFLSKSHFHKVLLATQVCARMTPAQKAQVVVELQSLGLYVGMCGDGANDCAALKASHVGVSLSESDASIAAPFTCKTPNIECIPTLLSAGRASLVTSFQLFRFMSLYSMIQFTTVILCYFSQSVLGNWQYLYQDLILVFPLTVLMGTSDASQDLTVKRPSGNLLSFRNIGSTILHMAICFAFQYAVYIRTYADPNYTNLATDAFAAFNWNTTALYYISNCQYLVMASLFSVGYPWKQMPYKNWPFVVWFVAAFIINMLYLLHSKGGNTFFTVDEVDLTQGLREYILLMIGLNFIVSWVVELVICPLIVRLSLRSDNQGSVLGKGVPQIGRMHKPYHPMRQQFEAGWPCRRAGFAADGVVLQLQ